MTANLVIESSQSITDDLRAIMNLLTIPYHIRIGKINETNLIIKMLNLDFWSICHSTSRDSLFVIHPSLATALNERNIIYAFHQEDELITEIDQIISNNSVIEKHVANLSFNNQSGISLRKLIAMNITVLKMPEVN